MSKLSLNNASPKRVVFSFFEGSCVFLMGLIVCLLSLGVWAYTTQVDKVVRVEGKIIPAGHSRQIQHFEGGIIASISTHEGALVKKGDLLMVVEDASAQAELNEVQVKLNSSRVLMARLQAEADGAARISMPLNILKSHLITTEKNLFESRKRNIEEVLRVHEEQILQHSAMLDENEEKLKRLLEELEVASKRSRLYEEMASNHAASQIEVLDAQSREKRLKTQISELRGSKPKLEASIREQRAQIARVKATFKSDVQKELTSVLSQIDQLKEKLLAAKDRKRRTEIRAPMDGVINRIAYNTVGSVIKSGQAIIELTPTSDEVMIEASASPNDRGELRSGIDAVVRVHAYDVSTLGALSGKVTEISADTVSNTKGSEYYRVKISMSELPPSYQSKELVPGMMVTADLVTGRRTIFNYLISPLRKFTSNMFRDPR